ncbi:MAG: hypothetical protein NVSMB3_15600 [Acidobacteriaceae bacterium]
MPIAIAASRQTSEQHSAAQLAALQYAERRWAYALLRLILGVNLFGHGFIRFYNGVPSFAEKLTAQMHSALLPAPLVHAFGLSIPWIELTLGTLLILAILTRITLTAAMIFMITLMIGVVIRQDWTTAGLQLVYGFVIFALLFLRIPYATSWPALLGISDPAPVNPVNNA